MQVKQCHADAVVMDSRQQLDIEDTDKDTCETVTRQNLNSAASNLHCLLPQHWTPVDDAQVGIIQLLPVLTKLQENNIRYFQ